MNTQTKTAADMIAVFFAGKDKTQLQLCEAVVALANTNLFPDMTAEQCEQIVKHNEATQGVKFF